MSVEEGGAHHLAKDPNQLNPAKKKLPQSKSWCLPNAASLEDRLSCSKDQVSRIPDLKEVESGPSISLCPSGNRR